MESIKKFIERNKDTYVKHSDVSEEMISKYKKMFNGRIPEELIWIWRNMGLGIYDDGYFQIIRPDEYEFIFQYVDKLLEPTIPWGITALGDILCWEGNIGWTIAPDEGNRVLVINVRNCESHVITGFAGTLNNFIGEIFFLEKKDYFNAKPYLQIKDKLPRLEYGQCYGYVPALALGGSRSIKNLQVVDAKSYIDTIGQAVGKIVDLED